MGQTIKLPEAYAKYWAQLTSTSNTRAMAELWACVLDPAECGKIADNIGEVITSFEGKDWGNSLSSVRTSILDNRWFIDGAYILTTSITLPGDSLAIERVGFSQTGVLRGLIGTGRNDLPMAQINFLETNMSFVDGFIRPWMIAVGYNSLKDGTLRMPNLNFVCFQKGANGIFTSRKTMILEMAAPVQVSDEEYNYSGDKLITRNVGFTYNKYFFEYGEES